MTRRVSHVLFRTVAFTLLLATLISLLFRWDRLPRPGPQPQDEYVRSRIEELQKVDPQAAVLLQRLRDQRAASDLAVAIRAGEIGSGNRISSLRELALRASDGQTPYEVQLATLARQSIDLSDPQQTEAFFQAHATTCQMLTEDKSGQAMGYYLDLLHQAVKDPVAWRLVRDDPVGLLLWPNLRNDPKALQYYEAEREWLAGVLAEFAPAHAHSDLKRANVQGISPDPTHADSQYVTTNVNDDVSAEQAYAESVTIAMQYHPLPKQAVQDLKLGAHGFSLFLAFGPIIKRAVNDYGLPLEEVLDVLYINGDGFGLPRAEPLRSQRAEEFAVELATIRKSRPKVWEAARVQPLALRLNKDVPTYADQLLEKYGANGVCAFLYANYEQQIVTAAAALAHYGDLGFYILKTYEDDPRLKTHLADSQVGILAVPFLARFGNAGFDKLSEDTDWVKRYFNTDGTPKKDDWEWIQAVPILGAPAYLVRNLAQGNPSEWSEWGWAAIDVADGALLVASFGTTAEVTAAKQVFREGSKVAIENLTKQEAKAFARRAAREAAAALRAGGRTAPKLARSALEEIVRTGGRAIRAGGEVFLIAGRLVGNIAEPAFAGVRRIRQMWGSIPPTVKRWIFRSLLAVGMIITIKERTIPRLRMVGEAIGEITGQLIDQAAKAIAAGLTKALDEVLGPIPLGRISAFWGGHAAACLVLALLAWRVAPWRRRSVQPV